MSNHWYVMYYKFPQVLYHLLASFSALLLSHLKSINSSRVFCANSNYCKLFSFFDSSLFSLLTINKSKSSAKSSPNVTIGSAFSSFFDTFSILYNLFPNKLLKYGTSVTNNTAIDRLSDTTDFNLPVQFHHEFPFKLLKMDTTLLCAHHIFTNSPSSIFLHMTKSLLTSVLEHPVSRSISTTSVLSQSLVVVYHTPLSS